MSGLKAATAAPTWPQINGAMFPDAINNLSPWVKNLLDNKIMVQFIHRGLAYLLLIMVFIWWLKAIKIKVNAFFNKIKWLPLACILLQVILGIATVITSPYGNNLIWFGIAHQFAAMVFLMIMIFMLYLIKKNKSVQL